MLNNLAKAMYLELLKKAILFEIWHEDAERYQPLTPDIYIFLLNY